MFYFALRFGLAIDREKAEAVGQAVFIHTLAYTR